MMTVRFYGGEVPGREADSEAFGPFHSVVVERYRIGGKGPATTDWLAAFDDADHLWRVGRPPRHFRNFEVRSSET
jgi:hypothetical protein